MLGGTGFDMLEYKCLSQLRAKLTTAIEKARKRGLFPINKNTQNGMSSSMSSNFAAPPFAAPAGLDAAPADGPEGPPLDAFA